MLHPATQAVERYYTLFNEKDWPGIAAVFDLPATVIVGPRKVLLDQPDAVTTLYRELGEKVHPRRRSARLVGSWKLCLLPGSR
jgi:hypothetical protein